MHAPTFWSLRNVTDVSPFGGEVPAFYAVPYFIKLATVLMTRRSSYPTPPRLVH